MCCRLSYLVAAAICACEIIVFIYYVFEGEYIQTQAAPPLPPPYSKWEGRVHLGLTRWFQSTQLGERSHSALVLVACELAVLPPARTEDVVRYMPCAKCVIEHPMHALIQSVSATLI